MGEQEKSENSTLELINSLAVQAASYDWIL